MSKNYNRQIASAIDDFMVASNWRYQFDDENGVFRLSLNLKGKINRVNYTIDVNENGYMVYAVLPVNATKDDKGMMAKMAEFLHRANYGLRVGNFEMDHADGEIRYKVYTICDGIVPTREMVRRSILVPVNMFERYGDGILSIIFVDGDPEALIRKCEGK